MKLKKIHVLNIGQLRKIATKFSLAFEGTIARPRFKKKGSKIRVEFDPIKGRYKSSNWKYWMNGQIADVVTSTIDDGGYPHPHKVKSVEAEINRLL
jgi:hypothetical protein